MSRLILKSLLFSLFVVCPILFFTDLTRNPCAIQIALVNVLLPLWWLVWLVQAWRKREGVWTTSALDTPLLLLISVCFLSWGVSFFNHRALWKPLYSEGSRAAIFLLVNTYGVYAAALNGQDQAFFKRLLLATYTVSVVVSIYGIAQYFGVEWIWPHHLNPYGSRPISTFGNPNFLSTFLVCVLPVLLADYLFQATELPRSLLFAALLCDLAALLATLTRSSWLGLVAGCLVFLWGVRASFETNPPLRRLLLGLGLAVTILVVGWPRGAGGTYTANVTERLSEVKQISRGNYAPMSQRYLIWLSAWHMVEDHPFLGKGWGGFEMFYPFYQGPQLLDPAFRSLRTHANNAHNEILEYWSQIGSIGLGIVFLLWIVFFRSGASIAVRLPVAEGALVWGLLGGVAGVLADNFLNVSVHFTIPAFFFWWWVGSVFILEPSSLRVHRWALHGIWRRAAVAVSGAVLIGLMVRSVYLWEGDIAFFKGYGLSKMGTDLIAAAESLERGYRFHALEVNNNYELANVYARMGQKDKALFMYQRALDANPGYDEIYFNRGSVLAEKGNTDEAIRNYRISLAINPVSREAYRSLTSLYMKDISRYGTEAGGLYQEALRVFPDDKELWNDYGYLLSQQRAWEESFQAYHRAVELDPDFQIARHNLQIIFPKVRGHDSDASARLEASYVEINRLMNEKRWDEALPRIRKIVQLFPASLQGRIYLGSVLFSLGRFPEAMAEFKEAVRLRSDGVTAWQNLALTYERLGQNGEAHTCYQRLLELDSNNALARARLGIK